MERSKKGRCIEGWGKERLMERNRKCMCIEGRGKERLKRKDGLLPDGRCPLEYLDSHP